MLLNGRRLANNAFDSSAPDLNMIPFAALERVEVLRDGASSLYGTDAISGVINFITRKRDYTGGQLAMGIDTPQHPGGLQRDANIGFGFGDLDKNGINVFGFVDFGNSQRISGTQRPFNTRFPGGLSPTPFPANWLPGRLGRRQSSGCAGCHAGRRRRCLIRPKGNTRVRQEASAAKSSSTTPRASSVLGLRPRHGQDDRRRHVRPRRLSSEPRPRASRSLRCRTAA